MVRRAIDESFYEHFQVVPAYTEALRDIAYRIRYHVYCEEFGFEDRNNFPDGREIDAFDRHAEHCLLLHRASNRYVGCVRLVSPDPQNRQPSLPFETTCVGLDAGVVRRVQKSRGGFGEISRLALLPIIRQPKCNGSANGVKWDFEVKNEPRLLSLRDVDFGPECTHIISSSRQYLRHISLGLYLAGSAMLLKSGLRGVFAIMEPRLARRLRQYGIFFRQVGNMINYRGLRAPFEITTKSLISQLHPEPRRLLDSLLDDLQRSNPLEIAVS